LMFSAARLTSLAASLMVLAAVGMISLTEFPSASPQTVRLVVTLPFLFFI
jgi:hypothetical protein